MRSIRRNISWLVVGIAFLTLLGTAQLADEAEAAVQICVAGPVYDPACEFALKQDKKYGAALDTASIPVVRPLLWKRCSSD